jgi:hypothetical protein
VIRIIFGAVLVAYLLLVIATYPNLPESGKSDYIEVVILHTILFGLPGALLIYFGIHARRKKQQPGYEKANPSKDANSGESQEIPENRDINLNENTPEAVKDVKAAAKMIPQVSPAIKGDIDGKTPADKDTDRSKKGFNLRSLRHYKVSFLLFAIAMVYFAVSTKYEPCFSAQWSNAGRSVYGTTADWGECEYLIGSLKEASPYFEGMKSAAYEAEKNLNFLKRKTFLFVFLCIITLVIFASRNGIRIGSIVFNKNNLSLRKHHMGHRTAVPQTDKGQGKPYSGAPVYERLIYFSVTMAISWVAATYMVSYNPSNAHWFGVLATIEILLAGIPVLLSKGIIKISSYFKKNIADHYRAFVWVLCGVFVIYYTYPLQKDIADRILDIEIGSSGSKNGYVTSESGRKLYEKLMEHFGKSSEEGGFGAIKIGESNYFIPPVLSADVIKAIATPDEKKTDRQKFIQNQYIYGQKLAIDIENMKE